MIEDVGFITGLYITMVFGIYILVGLGVMVVVDEDLHKVDPSISPLTVILLWPIVVICILVRDFVKLVKWVVES